jgi:hypothetical protein
MKPTVVLHAIFSSVRFAASFNGAYDSLTILTVCHTVTFQIGPEVECSRAIAKGALKSTLMLAVDVSAVDMSVAVSWKQWMNSLQITLTSKRFLAFVAQDKLGSRRARLGVCRRAERW